MQIDLFCVLFMPCLINTRHHCIPCYYLDFSVYVCVTDPACTAQEQPDPAVLPEAGPQAAPGSRHQHRWTGLYQDGHSRREKINCIWIVMENNITVCILGDGASVCEGAAAALCPEDLRRRRRGPDGETNPQRGQKLESCELSLCVCWLVCESVLEW